MPLAPPLPVASRGDNYETLKESVIGVFAQSDKMYDSNFKDEGTYIALLDASAATCCFLSVFHVYLYIHTHTHTVAFKSRNSRSQKAKNEDLRGDWSNERNWFEKESVFHENVAGVWVWMFR